MKIGSLLVDGSIKMEGKELILDVDGDTSLMASTDDILVVKIAGTNQFTFEDNLIAPVTANDIDLGASGKTYGLSEIIATICDTRVNIPHSSGDPTNNGDIKVDSGAGTGGSGVLKFKNNNVVQSVSVTGV